MSAHVYVNVNRISMNLSIDVQATGIINRKRKLRSLARTEGQVKNLCS